jgi:hypothetical protein
MSHEDPYGKKLRCHFLLLLESGGAFKRWGLVGENMLMTNRRHKLAFSHIFKLKIKHNGLHIVVL